MSESAFVAYGYVDEVDRPPQQDEQVWPMAISAGVGLWADVICRLLLVDCCPKLPSGALGVKLVLRRKLLGCGLELQAKTKPLRIALSTCSKQKRSVRGDDTKMIVVARAFIVVQVGNTIIRREGPARPTFRAPSHFTADSRLRL